MAGKKGKGKNHRDKRQGQQFNQNHQSRQENRQQVNVSQVTCSLCASPSKPGEDFVQCDECNLDFHFKCVGIKNIGVEDEWRCNNCVKKNATNPSTQDEMSFVNLCDQSTMNNPNDSSNNQIQSPMTTGSDNKFETSIDIHPPRLEDVIEENEINRLQTPSYQKHCQSTQLNGRSPRQPNFEDDDDWQHSQTQSNDRQSTQTNGLNTQKSDDGTTYRSVQFNDRDTQKSFDGINRLSTQSVHRGAQGSLGNAKSSNPENKPNSLKSLIEGSIRFSTIRVVDFIEQRITSSTCQRPVRSARKN